MANSLKVTEDGRSVAEVTLEPGRSYSLGRSQSNDIVLPAPSVSRRHAELRFESGGWLLADAGSSNGTFVGGTRIDGPVSLAAGSAASIGPFEIALDPGTEQDVSVSFSDREVSPGTVMLSLEDALGSPAGVAHDADQQAVVAGLDNLRRRFETVARANLELLGHQPIDKLLEKVLDLVIDAVHAERATILKHDDEGRLVSRALKNRGGEGFDVSRTVAETVLEQRAALLTADAQLDSRFAGQESVISQGIRSVMAVPLWNGEDVIGLIYADSSIGSHHFQEEDLRVLTMLANIAAIQIRNAALFEEQIEKRRLEDEAKGAAEVQTRLLPEAAPSLPGYLVHGRNVPCNEVGGDYFDYAPLGEKRHGIILADVAGKGMPAALLMAVVQSTFRATAESGAGPNELLRTISRAVARSAPSNRFVTAFLIDLDLESHQALYVNAGHAPAPCIVRRNGTLKKLEPGGLPLGIFPDLDYTVGEFVLEPGDLLVACTDGISEARDESGDLYGDERLERLLLDQAGRDPSHVDESIQSELKAYCGEEPQSDDETVVVLGRSA